jgi:hypothetical protein
VKKLPHRLSQAIDGRPELFEDGSLLGNRLTKLGRALHEFGEAVGLAEMRLHAQVDRAGIEVNPLGAAQPRFDLRLQVVEMSSRRRERCANGIGGDWGSTVT